MDYQHLVKELVESFGSWFEDEQKLLDGRMTANLYPYDKLFSPIQVNGVKIKNRIVMGPMGNVSMADETGRPSSKMIQYFAQTELKFIIPKEAFKPMPKVDSAVVHMKILEHPAVTVKDEKIFFRLVKTAFSHRRKTLSNSLKGLGTDIRDVIISAGIEPQRRPETLSLEEFARLSDALTK